MEKKGGGQGIGTMNFCKQGTMSACEAPEGMEELCEFYKKSSQDKNKCMYRIFGGHCDCLKAQIDNEKQERGLKEI